MHSKNVLCTCVVCGTDTEEKKGYSTYTMASWLIRSYIVHCPHVISKIKLNIVRMYAIILMVVYSPFGRRARTTCTFVKIKEQIYLLYIYIIYIFVSICVFHLLFRVELMLKAHTCCVATTPTPPTNFCTWKYKYLLFYKTLLHCFSLYLFYHCSRYIAYYYRWWSSM